MTETAANLPVATSLIDGGVESADQETHSDLRISSDGSAQSQQPQQQADAATKDEDGRVDLIREQRRFQGAGMLTQGVESQVPALVGQPVSGGSPGLVGDAFATDASIESSTLAGHRGPVDVLPPINQNGVVKWLRLLLGKKSGGQGQ